jgi:DNA-binding NtrC family response regulator
MLHVCRGRQMDRNTWEVRLMNSVLIVDDDGGLFILLSCIISEAGYEIAVAADGEAALREIEAKSPDIVLLDLKLSGMNGLAVLEQIKKISTDSNVIMLTGHGEIKDAVEAMKLGAFDFLTKPFKNEELLAAIKCACENINLSHNDSPDDRTELVKVIGNSPAIRTVLKLVGLVAPTTMTVVLQGESGAGKEVIAHLIHQRSHRWDRPLVAVDCATIPDELTESILFGHEKGAFTGAANAKEGLFERADEGTIFLDEIVNSSVAVQMKMLRIIQEKKLKHLGGKKDIAVDVRVITASNINLDEAVKAGKLRADLFHRLCEFVIDIPALRERRDDIPVLAHHFLQEANRELQKNISGFSTDALKLLLDAPWPGNVRELKNVVKRAALLAEDLTITRDEIAISEAGRFLVPISVASLSDPPASLSGKVAVAQEEVEKEELVKALLSTDGNKAKAARMLKMDRATIYAKLKKYHLPEAVAPLSAHVPGESSTSGGNIQHCHAQRTGDSQGA